MTSEQYQRFEQQLHRQLHRLIRESIDAGIRVHREEVVAAAVRFGLQHLQILLDDQRNA